MNAELQLLEEWIPEQMEPGTLFVLENAGRWASHPTLIGRCSLVLHAEPWDLSRDASSKGPRP